jgi:hypothetical protein
MIDMQEKFGEQLTQFSQYQKDAVAKLQAKSASGVDTFEKFARYNLAVMNDVVNFTVETARLASTTTEPQEYVSKQIDSASAFAKVVEGRTKEYIDLLSSAAETVTEEVQEATREAVVEAVKKSA